MHLHQAHVKDFIFLVLTSTLQLRQTQYIKFEMYCNQINKQIHMDEQRLCTWPRSETRRKDSDRPTYETTYLQHLKIEDALVHEKYGNNLHTYMYWVCMCTCATYVSHTQYPQHTRPQISSYSSLCHTHTNEAIDIKQPFTFILRGLPCMSTHSSSLVSTSSFFFFSSFLRSFFLFSIFPSLQIKVMY